MRILTLSLSKGEDAKNVRFPVAPPAAVRNNDGSFIQSIGGEMIRTVLAAGALALLAAGPAAAQTTLTVSGFGIAQDAFRRILYE
jgi:hypothetical protein